MAGHLIKALVTACIYEYFSPTQGLRGNDIKALSSPAVPQSLCQSSNRHGNLDHRVLRVYSYMPGLAQK